MLAENPRAQHTKSFSFVIFWHLCRSWSIPTWLWKSIYHEGGQVKSQSGCLKDSVTRLRWDLWQWLLFLAGFLVPHHPEPTLVFGRPLWPSKQWADFPRAHLTEMHQESGVSVGRSSRVFQDSGTQWFSDGLPLRQLLSIHRLRLAVKLLLMWPALYVACSRRSSSEDLVT